MKVYHRSACRQAFSSVQLMIVAASGQVMQKHIHSSYAVVAAHFDQLILLTPRYVLDCKILNLVRPKP